MCCDDKVKLNDYLYFRSMHAESVITCAYKLNLYHYHIVQFCFDTNMSIMANTYNMGTSCHEGQLEKDTPFESAKSTGVYDQIND